MKRRRDQTGDGPSVPEGASHGTELMTSPSMVDGTHVELSNELRRE